MEYRSAKKYEREKSWKSQSPYILYLESGKSSWLKVVLSSVKNDKRVKNRKNSVLSSLKKEYQVLIL